MGPIEYLSAYGLGSSLIAITILATSSCYAEGLSNLIPHAFGSNRIDLVYAYLNRMLILKTLIFMPILIPLQYSETFLNFMVKDPRIAHLAARYVSIVTLSMPFEMYATCYSQLFKYQGKPHYILISTIVSSICHWILSYYFCIVLEMKIEGVALATACYFTIRFLIREILSRLDPDFK